MTAELYRQTDAVLYEAKRNGKNRFRFAEGSSFSLSLWNQPA